MTHAAADIPSRTRPRLSILLIVLVLALMGLPQAAEAADRVLAGVHLDKKRQPFPPPPPVPALRDAPLPLDVQKALAEVVPSLRQGRFPSVAVKRIGAAGDGRLGWLLYDLLRFADRGSSTDVVTAFEKLTGKPLVLEPFTAMGDRLLAWNLPPPPGYRELKRDLFLLIEPSWAPFFDDPASDIDWRQVGWGGVFIDDRPDATQGAPCPRGCIPALDQPKVTPASQGRWYPDNAIVFGIVINGEARAYPKNMMEVHEMVNDTLGGRRIGIPYCTLCGAAQAYFTDRVNGVEPLLRTSGLLARSNKFMYDRRTWSAFDTFTGRAISGPLHKAGVTLKQATVVTSTWGAWRQAHHAPPSWLATAVSGAPTNSILWTAATTTVRSFQWAMSTPACQCTKWSWASPPRTAGRWPFLAQRRRSRSALARRYACPVSRFDEMREACARSSTRAS